MVYGKNIVVGKTFSAKGSFGKNATGGTVARRSLAAAGFRSRRDYIIVYGVG